MVCGEQWWLVSGAFGGQTDQALAASVEDPSPGTRDQAGVAELLKMLVDGEFDHLTWQGDRGWQRIWDVDDGHRCLLGFHDVTQVCHQSAASGAASRC